MSGNRIVLIIIILAIAGTILVGFLPQSPRIQSSTGSGTPLHEPTFSNDFKLPSLVALNLFPTVLPTPTTATPTPTPNATPTPSPTVPTNPNNPTPTNTNVHSQPTAAPTSGPQPTVPQTAGACSWMDNGLPHVTNYYPNGGTAMPATTREVCAFNATQYYSLPFRNANCTATQAGIDKAYERMRTYYPTYFANNKLLQDWKTVQQYAVKYRFNPLFVISLWIEESAAGGATHATKLGCDYRRNKDNTYTEMSAQSTICEEMECLFGLQSAYPGNYALWACNYRYGGNFWQSNKCTQAINNTRGIDFWYNYIGGTSLPAGCRIQYFSGADTRCLAF